MESIIIYEDEGHRKLLPLTYNRPVFDLRCGINTLREKITREYQLKKIVLFCRDYLKDTLSNSDSNLLINQFTEESALIINGRISANGLKDKVPPDGEDCTYTCKGEIVAVRVTGDNLKKVLNSLKNLQIEKDINIKSKEINVDIIEYVWNLIHINSKEIESDFSIINKKGNINGTTHENVNLINQSEIFIDQGALIYPNVVLDAEEGPIYIGKNVKILPHTTVIGPVFIGDNSLIKAGSLISEGTSIGEYCKVADEIESSIIHSYSNKQHLGFLGHSYIGKWVNLGAGTSVSDLKNNYSNVRMYVDGKSMDSGSMFVGSFIGDHSKTGINSMLNTGTAIGFSCNIFGGDFPPKQIASFTWGGAKGFTTYKPEKCIELAKTVMSRRNVSFTKEDEKLFWEIFRLTEKERNDFLQNH